VYDIIQLKDGTLLSCSGDKTIKQWTVEGQLLKTFQGPSSSVYCLMELDNSFLSGSYDQTLKVWDKTTGECLHSLSTTSLVWNLLRLRNNSTFLCGLSDGTIEEKSVDNFATLDTLKQHSNSVWSMCELSNGNVVSASWDKTAKEWNMETKTVVRTFIGHSDWIMRVMELRDKTIATASWDKTVRVWQESTGACVQVLRGHKLCERDGGTVRRNTVDWILRFHDS
jgi:WD40 repeat protein